ncbi:undecaprenyldiphospho-muramoylpentapeptide beta-N-acetylglucosaminyltransferase [Salsuginibacillus kocurii]|uniref:undecaprenyldiphospho-muramoylpentapeptide beta-N-acetylglucosaminyltransferase n=1 Tax=Salsuginibacillus kocurii TaxID=427078 RepID=UPI00036C191D|nr:undecaprenyldiphospho-muramoylpentapeptide beta-N-acetylglucosaminyltransferase [Salsuginibacillus kocurii]
MKVVVTGGGTGGHIYPALAFVRFLKKEEPHARIKYIGSETGLESDFVPRAGVAFSSVKISGFKRKLSLHNVRTVYRFLKAVKQAKKMFKEDRPDVVIGTGGYVSGPVVYAAARMNIPTIVHEQNSVPGLTNKFLSKYASRVAISFEDSSSYFPKEKVAYTGNPRAQEVSSIRSENPLASFGLVPEKRTVLVVGGSRGARPINDAFLDSIAEIERKDYQVLYVTGQVHYEKVNEKMEASGRPANIAVEPFLHNMPEVLPHIDVLVTRAGATTLAELTALGIPSILIPSPYVTNNHQEKNARTLETRGAAYVHLEQDWSKTHFIETLDELFETTATWERMHEAALNAGVPDASNRLYQVIKEVIESK